MPGKGQAISFTSLAVSGAASEAESFMKKIIMIVFDCPSAWPEDTRQEAPGNPPLLAKPDMARRALGRHFSPPLFFFPGSFYFILFFLRFLFIHERHTERQRHRRREKQAPCREPEERLDPGTLGSRPGPKADAQLLNPPGAPSKWF